MSVERYGQLAYFSGAVELSALAAQMGRFDAFSAGFSGGYNLDSGSRPGFLWSPYHLFGRIGVRLAQEDMSSLI